MKLTILMLFSIVCVLFAMPFWAKAAGSSVSLSATVVGPPTINDFDLSAINPDAKPISGSGTVLGTSATRDYSLQIVAMELGAVVLAILFPLFIKRKKRIPTGSNQELMVNSV